jgi:hypothetical protein
MFFDLISTGRVQSSVTIQLSVNLKKTEGGKQAAIATAAPRRKMVAVKNTLAK